MRRLFITILLLFAACSGGDSSKDPAASSSLSSGGACQFVARGFGDAGAVALKVEKIISGLTIPWGMAFLSNGDWLVTERPGRVRLVRGGSLQPKSVVEIATGEGGEGGLLGIALHPNFLANNYFYVFYTTPNNVNRVERFILSGDHTQASSDRVILDNIPAGSFHDGGRIKFGPDGNLYVATGDAQNPGLAQDVNSLNGKVLRVTSDGAIPAGNPFPGSPVYALGLRNLEAFDWVDPNTMIIADNGPTGELGLSGLDKVSFLQAGSNLGWPTITGCKTQGGLINPILSWQAAAPPGGGVICRNCSVAEFNGSFLIGMMGMTDPKALQLHRVVFDPTTFTLVRHEVYLQGQFGRLRDVEQGPDGTLYVTTTNCDTRGVCPGDGDYILRISSASR